MLTDLEIAQKAELANINEIATKAGISEEYLRPYGKHIAKVSHHLGEDLKEKPDGKLVLVTAMSPTSAGEGKTTTSIGLSVAVNRLGHRSIVTLREPSLGPIMGIKGGAAGGGYSQVLPMEEINLHFTGDIHAVTTAHNLLSAVIDAHLKFGNKLDIEPTQVYWPRAMDMNDRALREIIVALGGKANGYPRQDEFVITAASEIMAILCLAKDLEDLKERLGNIVFASNRNREFVTARDLNVHGAMAALLKDALDPNLVQTIEGTPAFVHGGPFANIAHGANTIMATKTALKLCDVVITEAGFGADLGGEKFLDFVCPEGGFTPSAVVIVASIRALKANGGVTKQELDKEDTAALARGFDNLSVHYENMRKYGVPVVVALNEFSADSSAEKELFDSLCREREIQYESSNVWAEGGKGGEKLAEMVMDATEEQSDFSPLIKREMPVEKKLETLAKEIYRAGSVELTAAAKSSLRRIKKNGFSNHPLIVAKTQYSISDDEKLTGAPSGYTFTVRDFSLSAGAGFVVAISGSIMRMPGLPATPNAEVIDIDRSGKITGLF